MALEDQDHQDHQYHQYHRRCQSVLQQPAMGPYMALYSNINNDHYNGQYQQLYSLYETEGAAALQPGQLRNRVYAASNQGGRLQHILHTRAANAGADDPGRIQLYHRAFLNEAGMVGQTPFDDIGYWFKRMVCVVKLLGWAAVATPQFCPVLCTIRQVLYLRSCGAPPETPLASYSKNNKMMPVTPTDITEVLRVAVTALGPLYGFLPKDISARSLRASGAKIFI